MFRKPRGFGRLPRRTSTSSSASGKRGRGRGRRSSATASRLSSQHRPRRPSASLRPSSPPSSPRTTTTKTPYSSQASSLTGTAAGADAGDPKTQVTFMSNPTHLGRIIAEQRTKIQAKEAQEPKLRAHIEMLRSFAKTTYPFVFQRSTRRTVERRADRLSKYADRLRDGDIRRAFEGQMVSFAMKESEILQQQAAGGVQLPRMYRKGTSSTEGQQTGMNLKGMLRPSVGSDGGARPDLLVRDSNADVFEISQRTARDAEKLAAEAEAAITGTGVDVEALPIYVCNTCGSGTLLVKETQHRMCPTCHTVTDYLNRASDGLEYAQDGGGNACEENTARERRFRVVWERAQATKKETLDDGLVEKIGVAILKRQAKPGAPKLLTPADVDCVMRDEGCTPKQVAMYAYVWSALMGRDPPRATEEETKSVMEHFVRIAQSTVLTEVTRDEKAFMHRFRYVAHNLAAVIGREDLCPFFPCPLQPAKRLSYDVSWNECAKTLGLPPVSTFAAAAAAAEKGRTLHKRK